MPVVHEDILEVISRTCKSASEDYASIASINDAAVENLATQLIPLATDVSFSALYSRPPIRFDDLREELDYMCLASLLDFGSGYDPLLKATATNKPAASSHRSLHDAAEFAVLGMAMQDSLPDAATMAEYPRYQVSGTFNIDASEEREVMPGVTMTSPGPLSPALASIQQVLNETGRALLDNGHSSLGAFVLHVVEEREKAGQVPSAAFLVEQLVENLKFGFSDCNDGGEKIKIISTTEGEEEGLKREQKSEMVVWHRKAQQLVGKLYLRFSKSDPRFDFRDIDELSVDSGEIMIAVFMEKGILQASAELQAKIDAGEDLHGSVEVVAMRAAAVEAGRRVCDEAKKCAAEKEGGAAAAAGEGRQSIPFAPRHLSAYLLRQAEKEECEGLTIHINTATVAY